MGVLGLLGLVGLLTAAGTIGAQLFETSATTQGTWNVPPPRLWGRLLRLRAVKQDLEALGWRTTSAYRDGLTNHLVNGAVESDHMDALALDGVVDNPAHRARVQKRLRELEALGVVRWVDEHDRGSGLHFHVAMEP